MIQDIRREYFGVVDNLYTAFKNSGFDNPIQKAIDAAEGQIIKIYGTMDKSELESLALETYLKYDNINVRKAYTMRSNENEPWFENTHPSYSYFWPRYEKYLKEFKYWSKPTIDSIDLTTNEILKSIGDPKSNKNFDKRGLVLGYVQSGKTANFTGLINKAFDIGYKLVIVLAGMHNDLRAQTQLRLEREVVGNVDIITGEKKGWH